MNSFSTRRQSAWAATQVHRCHGCGQEFRSEHMAAFHACARTQDDVKPELSLVGFVDERGEINRTKIDGRRREYLELGGLDLVFAMHARAFRNLLLEAELALASDTDIGKTEMLKKLVNILKEAQ